MINPAMPLMASGSWTPALVEPATVAASSAKRLIDIVVSALGLLFIAPLLLLAMAAIWVESGGPVLFRQRRTGLGGRPFVIFKLRTMYVAEDGNALRHATKDDSRVTWVGAFLRKSSIDELPQLFNILIGDMSLVGPRPHALAHDCQYALHIPDYPQRFRTRPGLTGLAQISGSRGEIRDVDCMIKRVRADLRYVEEWSLATDIVIALRTVPLLLRASQAY